MEFLLRLDTLGIVEMRYLRARERYRDWPPFLLVAASRQARVLAYLTRDVVEQLHEQMLVVEEAAGLSINDDDDDDSSVRDESEGKEEKRQTERESSTFSPAFAQALERLNDLARQRLGDASITTNVGNEELTPDIPLGDEDDALEQLQDAFIQMMEVVRELAEELSTDALKLTGRFRCVRTDIYFTQAESGEDDDEVEAEAEVEVEDDDDDDDDEETVELALVLRLFEEGRAKPDDLPVAELQLDVDDFERLHSTLDMALSHDPRGRRRKS